MAFKSVRNVTMPTVCAKTPREFSRRTSARISAPCRQINLYLWRCRIQIRLSVWPLLIRSLNTYATIKACGIPMHSRDFIGDSYMAGQPATDNFDRHEPWTISTASWQANHSVTRLAEYVGANETKFPCWERTPSPKLPIWRFAQKINKVEVYEYIPSHASNP